MPVTIKKSQLLYKDANTGQYVSVDAVADKTSEQQINGIQIAANEAVNSINRALEDVSTEPLTELPKKAYKNDLTTNVESLGSASSKAYSIGDYFYVADNNNDKSLYKVTANIASGATISPGTADSNNCKPVGIADEVVDVVEAVSDLKDDLSDVNERLYTEVIRSNLLETIITTWLQKHIRDNGSLGDSDISCTTDYIIPSQGRIALTVGDGYKAKVFEYLPNGGRVGLVKDNITGQNIFAVAIGNKLRVQVTRLDAGNIAPADITSSVIIIENVYNELLQLDKTFTESGKAADAKSVGNVLNMTGVPFVDGYHIATEGSTVDISSPVKSPNYSYCVADCSAGDYFLISAKGGGTPRAWCFIDGSGNSLAVSVSDAEVTHETLIAPPNAVKLIVNNSDIISFPYYCYKGKTAEVMETEVNNKINFTNARLGLSEKSFSPGYITTKSVNQTIDPTPNEGLVYMYAIVPCTKGQPFFITGTPRDNSGQRLYTFTNANYVVIYRHEDPSAVKDYQIYAPADGYLIVNVLKASEHYLYSGFADYLTSIENISSKIISSKINFTNDRLGLSEKKFSDGYITTLNPGRQIDVSTITSPSDYAHAIVPCIKGQPFFITGTPTDNSGRRLYVFTDSNYYVSYRHDDPSPVEDYQIYAPADGYLIVNVLKANKHYLYSGLADYLMLKARQDSILLSPFTTLPNLLGISTYRQLGRLSKGYIVMMTDDGDDGLATDTIPLAIEKNVPFTFALMQRSNIFKNETYVQTLLDAIENHGCSVAQHGAGLWSRMTEAELNSYFDTEKTFFDSLGIEVKGAVVPAHDTSELVKAVCGGRFGVVRSGYSGRIYETGEDQHSVTNYYNYYTSGERSNIFCLSSYNNSTAQGTFNTEAIDYAYANNKILICYFHENAMTTERWTIVSNMIDYAKTKGLTFITLGDIPFIL